MDGKGVDKSRELCYKYLIPFQVKAGSMRAYIIRRVLLIIPTVFLVTIILFFMIRLIPGDILDTMVHSAGFTGGGQMDLPAIERALGIDVPVHVQYGRWLGVLPGAEGNFSGILQGDLGISLWTQLPVAKEIAHRLPVSIELGLLALLIEMIVSLPIGIYSAMRQDSAGDYAGRSVATLFMALPPFWVGIMVILLGSLWFRIPPSIVYISFTKDPIGNLRQFIIPAFILGMVSTGTIMRMTRSMMLEVLRQDYIRTAWAKGLKERVIIIRHALKNALIPVITLFGITIPPLLGGSVIIEVIFSLPGLGRLLVNAINVRDYTLVCGVIFVYAFLLVLVNLAVDLTYGYLDPRVHVK